MKFTLFILFLFFCKFFTLNAQDNSSAKKIFDESFNASQKISACSYDATWKILPIGFKDTVNNPCHVQIKLNVKNPLGIDSFYYTYFNQRIAYNGKTFSVIDSKENSVRKITDTQKIREQLSNMPLSLFVLFYINTGDSPTQSINDAFNPANKITVQDKEFIGNDLCYRITVEYPDWESIHSRKEEFYISTTSKLLRRITNDRTDRSLGDGHQHFSVEISNLKIEPQQFSPQYYKDVLLEERIPKVKLTGDVDGLSPGQQLPAIKITTLDNQVFDFTANKDTMYLLYAWFIGCAPCEQSRPMMKEFYEKYSLNHPFKIIGMNISNKDENVIQRYLDQKGIKYPNAIVGKKDKELLKVEPPSFILVKGNIVLFFQSGYNPALKERIEHVIIPNL